MMLDQININYSFNYWSEFFLESCFDESKTWSEKSLHEIRFANFVCPHWIRRRGHGGAFSCSCISSCFVASNKGVRTQRWMLKWAESDRTINVTVPFSCQQFKDWFNALCSVYWNNAAQSLRPLNNRKCRFGNGFNFVQNRRPCSLSEGTSNGTTPSSHRTFSFELS